jgi:hypothetical protein
MLKRKAATVRSYLVTSRAGPRGRLYDFILQQILVSPEIGISGAPRAAMAKVVCTYSVS